MRNVYKILILSLALAMISSCNKEDIAVEFASAELTAIMESGAKTKTTLSGLEGGMYYPLWSEGDEIAVYADGDKDPTKFSLESGDGTVEASFSGTRQGEKYYAIYPYSAAGTMQNGTISLTLPQTQQYIAGSFGPDSYPMVAQGTGSLLNFKNLCAILKISITGEAKVSSIVLTANDGNTYLSGKATIAADFGSVPELKMSYGGSNSITLECNQVQLSKETPTDFHFVIPAQSYKGGFTVEVNFTTEVIVKNVNADLQFKRSQIRHLKGMYLEMAPNNAPSKPVNLKPANNEQGVSTMPVFSWDASVDEDGDEINYKVHLSKNGIDWIIIDSGASLVMTLPMEYPILDAGQKYYYKVSADDGKNNGYTESDIQTFVVTATRDAYADGEYQLFMESTKENPVVFVFTGDGYLPEHFRYGGQFDSDIDSAIDGLFSIEPYKSYKEYFTVYKIAAYSNETGITNISTGDERDTKFKLKWEGGRSTGISCNYDSVLEWVMNIPGINRSVLKKGAIGVISNADVYAGTCVSYSDGVSISMIPYLKESKSSMTNFKNVVVHEMGGHGFGRLGDEYMYYNEMLPDTDRSNLITYQTKWSYPFCLNISVYPEMSNSLWAHFEGVEGYSHVGMYEGAELYYKGVWRAEQKSCMDDNRMYYNSPSRFYIVKRILEIAGEVEPFSHNYSTEQKALKMQTIMEIFMAKDVQKTDPNATKGWEGIPYDFIPLGEPILIEFVE